MKKSKKKAKKVTKSKAKTVKKEAPKKIVNKTGIIPMGDRVLVKPIAPEEATMVTSFGLVIPETVDKTKPNQGIVIAVGTGKKNENGDRVAFDVEPGDRIYFSKPWNEPEKINGEEYYFVQESDILAIIRK